MEPPPGRQLILEPFVIPPTGDAWENVPAAFHRDGVNVTFADGHCEFYSFSDSRTAKLTRNASTPDNPDLKQFQSWAGGHAGKFVPKR